MCFFGDMNPTSPRPLISRPIFACVFLLIPAILNYAIDVQAAEARPQYEPPHIEPLSPEQSLARIHLPPGYRVELVASEPMIEEPVMCAWDADGRMFVAEMRTYMQDTDGSGANERVGRVKRLEDTDGDGKMDKVTVFADGLLLPRMVLPLDDRVIIQETNDTSLISFRDTDGDGRADERILMRKGVPWNDSVEHQDSALSWNIDNWLYTAKGGWRHRFAHGKLESEKCETQTDNQWGLGMDDVGTLFFSHNSFPGRGFQQPWYAWSLLPGKSGGRYVRPSLGSADTDAAFHRIYPVHKIGDRQDTPNTLFTSACGISIYRGDAMPALRGDMFICEPSSHMVRRAKVVVTDGKRTLRNAHEQAEFFASEDFYCRPVWTGTGPDGCLYVVDMYRGIIQDKPWLDAAFAKRLQTMGADQVKRRGRIWRIVPDDFRRPQPKRLLAGPTAELVTQLADPNGFTRDAAQRLIVLRQDRAVVPLLVAMRREHAEPLARLHALWTLEGLDALEQSVVFAALEDRDPRVRAAAVRLTEPWLKQGDEAAHLRLASMTADKDIDVLRQLILSLGWSTRTEAVKTIEAIVTEHLDSEVVYLATMTAMWGQRSPLMERLLTAGEFQRIADPAQRDAARQRWKSGIMAWSGTTTAPRALDAEGIELVSRGATVYARVCSACHGSDGKGLQPPGSPPLAPSLDGSERLRGQKESLVRIVLHGLKGDLDGKKYAGGMMPSLIAMDDASIAAALSYVRQSWKNDEEPVREADVAAVRRASAARTDPWTPAELDRYAAPVLADSRATTAKKEPFPFQCYRGFEHNKALGQAMEPDPAKRGPWIHGQMVPGHWFAVDLVQPTELTAVVLDAREGDLFPRGWELRLSDDGENWSEPAASGRGTNRYTAITFEPVTTRFFKITQTAQREALDSGGRRADLWQVFDFRVHGRPASSPVASAAGELDGPVSSSAPSAQLVAEKLATPSAQTSPAPTTVAVAKLGPKKPERLRALIIDGQNNHDFCGTSEGIRETLASTTRFGDWSQVRISRSPIWWGQSEPQKPKGGEPAALAQYEKDIKVFSEARLAYGKQTDLSRAIWRPPFDEADVVIVNYYGIAWPQHVQEAFVNFVRNGGGAVIVHAANNAFEEWPAYNEMLGIGWRSAKFGRWIVVDDKSGKLVEVPEEKPAASSHDDFVPFIVKSRAPDHPIMAGLPAEWMHGADELYVRMRGTSDHLNVLASALSPNTKQHEPVLWCTTFGKGRVVTTSMGHYQRPAHFSSLMCLGFQTILARSCEWAATTNVTIPVPESFPTKDGSRISTPKEIKWKSK